MSVFAEIKQAPVCSIPKFNFVDGDKTNLDWLLSLTKLADEVTVVTLCVSRLDDFIRSDLEKARRVSVLRKVLGNINSRASLLPSLLELLSPALFFACPEKLFVPVPRVAPLAIPPNNYLTVIYRTST